MPIKKSSVSSSLAFIFFFGFLFFLKVQNAFSQDSVSKFQFRLKVSVDEGRTGVLQCLVLKDGIRFKNFDIQKKMDYMSLDFNSHYLFTVSKVGYTSQSLEVNTEVNIVDSALIKYRYQFNIPPFTAKIELQKQPDDSIINYLNPLGIVKYSIDNAEFSFVKVKQKSITVSANSVIDTIVKIVVIPKFNLSIQIKLPNKNAIGTHITINKNNLIVGEFAMDSSTYNAELDINENYVIMCSKEGYVSKSVEVNTHSPKWSNGLVNTKFKTVIKLEQQPASKVVAYSNPVGSIYFDYHCNDFSFAKNDYEIKETK